MCCVKVEQRLLELAQLEEPVLLAGRHELHRAFAIGTDEFAILVLLKIAFSVERLLVHAVPALVAALIQVALVIQVGPELLHGTRLSVTRRAHEIRVCDV